VELWHLPAPAGLRAPLPGEGAAAFTMGAARAAWVQAAAWGGCALQGRVVVGEERRAALLQHQPGLEPQALKGQVVDCKCPLLVRLMECCSRCTLGCIPCPTPCILPSLPLHPPLPPPAHLAGRDLCSPHAAAPARHPLHDLLGGHQGLRQPEVCVPAGAWRPWYDS